MVLVGNAFNFVHESHKQYVLNRGTILAWFLFIQTILHLDRSVMAYSTPFTFVPPTFEENRAFIIFFSYGKRIDHKQL